MQLKQIKYIKNKHSIPGFVEGADSGIKFQMSDDADVGFDQYGQFGKQSNPSLTDDDISVLEAIITKFGKYTKAAIVKTMHDEIAYTETAKNDIIQFKYAKELSID